MSISWFKVWVRDQSEIKRLHGLLERAIPHIYGNVGEWRELAKKNISQSCNEAAADRVDDGMALLADIHAALELNPVEYMRRPTDAATERKP